MFYFRRKQQDLPISESKAIESDAGEILQSIFRMAKENPKKNANVLCELIWLCERKDKETLQHRDFYTNLVSRNESFFRYLYICGVSYSAQYDSNDVTIVIKHPLHKGIGLSLKINVKKLKKFYKANKDTLHPALPHEPVFNVNDIKIYSPYYDLRKQNVDQIILKYSDNLNSLGTVVCLLSKGEYKEIDFPFGVISLMSTDNSDDKIKNFLIVLASYTDLSIPDLSRLVSGSLFEYGVWLKLKNDDYINYLLEIDHKIYQETHNPALNRDSLEFDEDEIDNETRQFYQDNLKSFSQDCSLQLPREFVTVKIQGESNNLTMNVLSSTKSYYFGIELRFNENSRRYLFLKKKNSLEFQVKSIQWIIKQFSVQPLIKNEVKRRLAAVDIENFLVTDNTLTHDEKAFNLIILRTVFQNVSVLDCSESSLLPNVFLNLLKEMPHISSLHLRSMHLNFDDIQVNKFITSLQQTRITTLHLYIHCYDNHLAAFIETINSIEKSRISLKISVDKSFYGYDKKNELAVLSKNLLENGLLPVIHDCEIATRVLCEQVEATKVAPVGYPILHVEDGFKNANFLIIMGSQRKEIERILGEINTPSAKMTHALLLAGIIPTVSYDEKECSNIHSNPTENCLFRSITLIEEVGQEAEWLEAALHYLSEIRVVFGQEFPSVYDRLKYYPLQISGATMISQFKKESSEDLSKTPLLKFWHSSQQQVKILLAAANNRGLLTDTPSSALRTISLNCLQLSVTTIDCKNDAKSRISYVKILSFSDSFAVRFCLKKEEDGSRLDYLKYLFFEENTKNEDNHFLITTIKKILQLNSEELAKISKKVDDNISSISVDGKQGRLLENCLSFEDLKELDEFNWIAFCAELKNVLVCRPDIAELNFWGSFFLKEQIQIDNFFAYLKQIPPHVTSLDIRSNFLDTPIYYKNNNEPLFCNYYFSHQLLICLDQLCGATHLRTLKLSSADLPLLSREWSELLAEELSQNPALTQQFNSPTATLPDFNHEGFLFYIFQRFTTTLKRAGITTLHLKVCSNKFDIYNDNRNAFITAMANSGISLQISVDASLQEKSKDEKKTVDTPLIPFFWAKEEDTSTSHDDNFTQTVPDDRNIAPSTASSQEQEQEQEEFKI